MSHDLPPTPADIENARVAVDAWLARELRDNPVVEAVEQATPGDVAAVGGGAKARWYLRVVGEEKSVFTAWLTLRQRTLHYETYLMPAPETNAEVLYEHLLRRNRTLRGVALCIGEEDAVFLAGEIPLPWIDDDTLDEVLGAIYAGTELCFRPAMRIGFAGKFKG